MDNGCIVDFRNIYEFGHEISARFDAWTLIASRFLTLTYINNSCEPLDMT
jgi:hypothetical protein